MSLYTVVGAVRRRGAGREIVYGSQHSYPRVLLGICGRDRICYMSVVVVRLCERSTPLIDGVHWTCFCAHIPDNIGGIDAR